MINNPLFTLKETMQFQSRLKGAIIHGAKAPFMVFVAVLQVLAFSTVCVVEWEIFYRVFDYLAGDAGYWSPKLMGLSAAVMLLGFHLLMKQSPNSFATRFVQGAVQILIPVYLMGSGLFIAVMLLGDELANLTGSDLPIVIGELATAPRGHWIEALFSSFTHPLALIAFAIGIGGLAIVNIFVANNLMSRIAKNIEDARLRLSRAEEAVKDHAAITSLRKRYAALQGEYSSLDVWDEFAIRIAIASEVLGLIADALLPHKKWLSSAEIEADSRFGKTSQPADPKQIASAIKKIEAISLAEIVDALTPPQYLENKK